MTSKKAETILGHFIICNELVVLWHRHYSNIIITMYSTVLKSSVYLTSVMLGVMLVIQSNALMDENWEVVTVQNGSIRGELKTNTLFSDSDYYAFHAVPYADPPIGTLRFKLPEPYSKSYGNSTHPYDASNPYVKKVCPQLKEGNFIDEESMDEDCLHLSVYRPASVNDSLPVLVWIHGGHFEYGSGMHQFFGPQRFMKDKDIIMVSINYRLGALGFLSLGNPELPGNAGFWDQVWALKWVQSNIEGFGGDPNMVTIMGEDAGSWSVMYQLLSPQSAGLFKRVISQSGTPMSPAYHEYSEEKAKRYVV